MYQRWHLPPPLSGKLGLKIMRKRIFNVMKEILGKTTTKSPVLPNKITVNKTDMFDKQKIADEFNNFFTNIGSDLANEIQNASNSFYTYVTEIDNTSMKSQPLSINELKDTFFPLEMNKSPEHDGLISMT